MGRASRWSARWLVFWRRTKADIARAGSWAHVYASCATDGAFFHVEHKEDEQKRCNRMVTLTSLLLCACAI
jgi:hypothetical protein